MQIHVYLHQLENSDTMVVRDGVGEVRFFIFVIPSRQAWRSHVRDMNYEGGQLIGQVGSPPPIPEAVRHHQLLPLPFAWVSRCWRYGRYSLEYNRL